METDDGCPECTAPLARDGDETICTDCGLVVDEDRLDRGPEWRSFEGETTNRERVGAPLTRSRHDRGLSTEIGRGGGSSSVRVTGRKRRRLARMRREHDRARVATKRDRNKVYSFTEIRRLVGALDLPRDVREQACALFDSAQSEDLLQGRTLEGFAAATVYAVCRTRSIARTIDEVLSVARADEGELRSAYDALNRELGLPTGPIDPGEYVPRFASELDLPDVVERLALELATLGMETGIASGRDPSGFAGGCLYTAARDCGYGLTQADAADAAGVSPVTLRKAYHDLEEVKGKKAEGQKASGEEANGEKAKEEEAKRKENGGETKGEKTNGGEVGGEEHGREEPPTEGLTSLTDDGLAAGEPAGASSGVAPFSDD